MSASPARLMIYKDKIVFDNPCTQHHFGEITLQNLQPYSHNPTICKFMIQLGRFDELGSGVRNINHYLPLFANGTKPVFKEDKQLFKLILPLETSEKERATAQVTAQATAQVTAQVCEFCSEPRTAREIMELLGLKHWKTFQSNYLTPLLETGFIELTIPDKPKSSKQKYRLTELGRTKRMEISKQP